MSVRPGLHRAGDYSTAARLPQAEKRGSAPSHTASNRRRKRLPPHTHVPAARQSRTVAKRLLPIRSVALARRVGYAAPQTGPRLLRGSGGRGGVGRLRRSLCPRSCGRLLLLQLLVPPLDTTACKRRASPTRPPHPRHPQTPPPPETQRRQARPKQQRLNVIVSDDSVSQLWPLPSPPPHPYAPAADVLLHSVPMPPGPGRWQKESDVPHCWHCHAPDTACSTTSCAVPAAAAASVSMAASPSDVPASCSRTCSAVQVSPHTTAPTAPTPPAPAPKQSRTTRRQTQREKNRDTAAGKVVVSTCVALRAPTHTQGTAAHKERPVPRLPLVHVEQKSRRRPLFKTQSHPWHPPAVPGLHRPSPR